MPSPIAGTGCGALLVVGGNALMVAARFGGRGPAALLWGAGLFAILVAVWRLPATDWALRRAILVVALASTLLPLGLVALLGVVLPAGR
jgi:hypothetical protein